MSTITEKVRQHFRSIRDGKFRPQFVQSLLPDDPWIVFVGNIPVHLGDYYAAQAKRDREEARRLVAAPDCPHPFFKKTKEAGEKELNDEAPTESCVLDGQRCGPGHDSELEPTTVPNAEKDPKNGSKKP